VARKTQRPRAELVAEFLSAMHFHFHGDIWQVGEARVKALRSLLAFENAIPILPGEPTAGAQLDKLIFDARFRDDEEFFKDYTKARRPVAPENVFFNLKDCAFIVTEQLIREHEPNGTLPTKREIRLAALRMRERMKLVLDDRDFSFRKLPPSEQKKKVDWELMCQDENSKFWTRFFIEARLRDLLHDNGGQTTHRKLLSPNDPTIDKS
jgi:hypothetical protein